MFRSSHSDIRFDAAAFLSETRFLSDAERGIYISLVSVIHEYCGPIENNSKRLAMACGADESADFESTLNKLLDLGLIHTTDSGELFKHT